VEITISSGGDCSDTFSNSGSCILHSFPVNTMGSDIAWDPAMVACCPIASFSSVASRAVISTGIAVSTRSVRPLAACFGGVCVHLAVGASVHLLWSTSPTSSTPAPTPRPMIHPVLKVMGITSRCGLNFAHESRLFFLQSSGIQDVMSGGRWCL
jgi:hypothetical protein